VDAEFAAWLAEAYRVGAQEHLRRPPWPDPAVHTGQMDRERAGPDRRPADPL